MSPPRTPGSEHTGQPCLCAAAFERGFTLIELLVTIAIGVLLMVVAVPSFIDFRRNANLSDAVSSFILANGTAKSTALKTGNNVFIEVNDAAIGWRSGWFVYIDKGWNNTYDAADDEVVLRHEELSADVVTTTPGATTLTDGYVLFNGSGFPQAKLGAFGNSRLTMATTTRGTNVFIDTSGRVRACRAGVDPGCPAL